MTLDKAIASFFYLALIAISAQNVVFSRALGISRLMRFVGKGIRSTLLFGALLCGAQILSGLFSYFLSKYFLALLPDLWPDALRPLAYVLCMIAAFFILFALSSVVAKGNTLKEVMDVLAVAAFNTAVLGTLLLSHTQKFNLVQTLGFGLGSGIGYLIAILAVIEGQRKLQGRDIPAAFKGLPANLLFIGIIAMAVYAFTGHMVLI